MARLVLVRWLLVAPGGAWSGWCGRPGSPSRRWCRGDWGTVAQTGRCALQRGVLLARQCRRSGGAVAVAAAGLHGGRCPARRAPCWSGAELHPGALLHDVLLRGPEAWHRARPALGILPHALHAPCAAGAGALPSSPAPTLPASPWRRQDGHGASHHSSNAAIHECGATLLATRCGGEAGKAPTLTAVGLLGRQLLRGERAPSSETQLVHTCRGAHAATRRSCWCEFKSTRPPCCAARRPPAKLVAERVWHALLERRLLCITVCSARKEEQRGRAAAPLRRLRDSCGRLRQTAPSRQYT